MLNCFRKKILLVVFGILMACCSGCGGGGDDDDGGTDPSNETPANIGGDWQGTIKWESGEEWKVDLSLSQNSNTISGGNIEVEDSDGDTFSFDDGFTGSVNGSEVEILIIYKDSDDLEYELTLTGNLNDNILSGDSALHISDNREGKGSFTLTNNENDSDHSDDSDDSNDQQTYEVEVGSCFTLATGTAEYGHCDDGGDIYFWPGGLNQADLFSDERIFCGLDGTYASLESIPDDYSDCDWTIDVEGNITSIDNTGFIVMDVSLTHHYKMLIISNDPGVTTLQYEQID